MFFRPRILMVICLIIVMWLVVNGHPELKKETGGEQGGISWTVAVTYPVNPARSADGAVIRWVFRVVRIQCKDGITWWHVEVRESQNEIPVVGTFDLDPDQGRIRRIVVREMVDGRWREYPMAEAQPTQFHLQTFSPLPLDFASPMLGPEIAQSAKGMLLRSWEQKLDSHNTFRHTYRISATTHPADSPGKDVSGEGPSLTLTVRPVTDSKRVWQFGWRSGSPWWTNCRTMAYSARLVEVQGVGGK